MVYQRSIPTLHETVFSFILLFILLSPASKAQEYVEGKIITTKGDTLTLKLLKYKSRKQEAIESFLSVQVQQDSGKLQTFYPADIAGYIKEGLFFRTFRTKTADWQPISFFGKQLANGRAELYYYPGDEKNPELKYFFRKRNEKDFIIWNGSVISQVEDIDKNPINAHSPATGGINFKVISNEEAVRQYFMKYFADCTLIVNKLKSGFYNGSDVSGMFREYNTTKMD